MRDVGREALKLVEAFAFRDTLVGFTPEEPIAILRLDGDWYQYRPCNA